MYPLIPRLRALVQSNNLCIKKWLKSWRAETLINQTTVVRPNLSPYPCGRTVAKKREPS